MKAKEKFDRSIKVLVKAYMSGTLNAMSCVSCAVGNLLGHGSWYGTAVFDNLPIAKIHKINIFNGINPSGYSEAELARIEEAFLSTVIESAGSRVEYDMLVLYNKADEANFDGLMAVVDLLQKIHGCTDEETKAAKLQFEKV